jgi:hypothetical protein
MKLHFLIAAATVCFTLIASPSHAQILGQNLKVFIGYSNLQGEGLRNQNTAGWPFNGDFFRDRTTLHGGNASITGTFRGVGITGDFSLNRNNRHAESGNVRGTMNTDMYYFMAGPSFHYNGTARLEPFGRVLAGGAHTNFEISSRTEAGPLTTTTSFEAGSTSFAMGVGGGLDLRLGDGPYRIRLVQVDYTPVFLRDKTVQVLQQAGALTTTLDGQRQDNVRFSFGFVF